MEHDEFSDEAVLNPPESQCSKRDILTVTVSDVSFGVITPMELMQLKSRSKLTHDLTSQGSFKKRILEYVHIRNAETNPVRLIEINRIFQHPARKLGITSKQVAIQLINTGRLVEFEQGSSTALFSTVLYNEIVKANGDNPAGIPARLMSNIGL